MRVLFDTNVILDLLLARSPFDRAATALFVKLAQGELFGVVGATTLTTIHYLARKQLGLEGATRAVHRLMQLLEVAPVTKAVLEEALRAELPDFEDAVLAQAALAAGVTAVVTRDPKGFAGAGLEVFAPTDLLAALEA